MNVRILYSGIVFIAALHSGFFGTGILIHAQGEANFWYFGVNAGLDFNGGPPVAVTNGQMNQLEGCSSISNAAGTLLFYTDGITVWNANHLQMPNGFGLMGHSSATQSALIVQKPGSSTIYYIFTVDAVGLPNGLRYSEVDMALNGGLGDITANKNILLNTPTCEKITGIRHCNNQDLWVVSHDWNSNAFRTYLVTSAGVNPVPVITNIGVAASSTYYNNSMGYLKGSPDGNKIASAKSFQSVFELFDFNNSTGTLSNAILFTSFLPACCSYGIEFSPDGTKLYGSDNSSGLPGNIYQFDLCAGSNAAIANSGVLVATSSSPGGALQLGPDNKIYLARAGDPWLGVINNPNTLGVGCGYVDNGVSLSGKVNAYGLPNFVPYYFKPLPPPFTASVNCLTAAFTAPTVNLSNCSGSANAITSQSWNFGDPASGANNTSTNNNPTHAFTNAGTYTVTLVLNYACGSDTIRQNVTAVNCGGPLQAGMQGPCTKMCLGSCQNVQVMPSGGTPPYTFVWLPNIGSNAGPYSVCPTTSTNYNVKVFDAAGDSAAASCLVTIWPVATASFTTTAATCGNNNGTATVTVSGGMAPYTYSWSPSGGTASTATSLGAGTYSVTIRDAVGCSQTQTITISQSSSFTVSVTTNTASCLTANGDATATPSGGTPGFTYLWNNGQTTQTATGLLAGTYSVTIIDAAGCTQTAIANISNTGSPQGNISPVVHVSCNGGNDGSLTLNVTVGAAPYTYSWNPSGQTTSAATGLAAGNYAVTVTDALGCVVIVQDTIIEPAAITATVTSINTSCTGATGLAALNAGGGTSGYTYLWSNGQTTQIVTALAAGNYTVIITDANGCTHTQTVSIFPDSGTLSVTVSSTQAGCTINNGTATANVSGGTNPLTYNWNNGQNTQTATGLSTGNYTVTVTDANGCVQTQVVNVTQVPGPSVSVSASALTIPAGGSTTLTATGGGTYSWSPSTGLSCVTCANPIASPTQATTYCAVVTDNNGCNDSVCITIDIFPPADLPCEIIYIPNAFSPNNDLDNDLECVFGSCIEIFHIAIYNRWGEKVFESFDQGICWDGTDREKPLNTAVFHYYLEATLTNGEKVVRKGNISLIR